MQVTHLSNRDRDLLLALRSSLTVVARSGLSGWPSQRRPVELSLGREAGGDVAAIVPMPSAAAGADSAGDAVQCDPMAGVGDDLAAAEGGLDTVGRVGGHHDLGGRAPQLA